MRLFVTKLQHKIVFQEKLIIRGRKGGCGETEMLTMQILDSIVPDKSTLEKMILPVFSYLKATPLSI
jgi:hypothetical protein